MCIRDSNTSRLLVPFGNDRHYVESRHCPSLALYRCTQSLLEYKPKHNGQHSLSCLSAPDRFVCVHAAREKVCVLCAVSYTHLDVYKRQIYVSTRTSQKLNSPPPPHYHSFSLLYIVYVSLYAFPVIFANFCFLPEIRLGSFLLHEH